MLFASLYLNNLSKRLGGAKSSAEAAESRSAKHPGWLRLAAIDGHRIGHVEPVAYNPASRRRGALRLVAVNGARLA